MRPIDLAREHGLSAQAIRNYDDAGILPPTERTDNGYRRYTPAHAQALRAFLALRAGHGHERAAEILRSCHRGDTESAYRLIDATHTALHTERGTHTDVATALDNLSATPPDPIPGRPLTVGELAHRLGVHAATLRTWETEGILRPERDPATGYRHYRPDAVRDAEIARQLRRGGYPLARVAHFLESLHEAGGTEALTAFLTAWQQRLNARGRALLSGAAQLDAYLLLCERM
ncbi:TioE family transcriptional regulator [Nocardia sp. NPDC056611]|uniref:TioE family transcriptional regulator n=1 Tax=Nocardia sp. NPDC056611 TaxID=3345877 RepID=UPI00366BA156